MCGTGLIANFIICCDCSIVNIIAPAYSALPKASASEKKAISKFIDESDAPYPAWRDTAPESLQTALSSPIGKKLSPEAKRFWHAYLLKRQGRVEEAAAEFEKCTQLDYYSPWALAEFAQAYFQSGDEKRAYKMINMAIAGGSVNGQDYELKAQLEGMRGNINQEAADYIKAAKLCSKAGEVKCTRYLAFGADSLRRVGKADEAVKLLSNLAGYKIDNTNPSILLERGKCFVSLKKYDAAIKDYSAAIAMANLFIKNNPTNPGAAPQQIALVNGFRERARCYELMGKTIEAARDQAKFKELSAGLASDMIGK